MMRMMRCLLRRSCVYYSRSEKRPRRSGAELLRVCGREGFLPQNRQFEPAGTVPVVAVRNSECDLPATIVSRFRSNKKPPAGGGASPDPLLSRRTEALTVPQVAP